METNILKVIKNIIENPITIFREHNETINRANSMGDALEEYTKDIFGGTIGEPDEQLRMVKLSERFSYLGNKNNPPDIIIKDGDAIEVKKIENHLTDIALNSSYPKAKLYASSNMITKECRECESWEEKDIIYVIGTVPKPIKGEDKKLTTLIMVYGEDYAANRDTYTRIKDVISNGINSIPNVEMSETRELGRANKVDPLGITYLRIRGMWGIQNPAKVFNYLPYEIDNRFNLVVIINDKKFDKFPENDKIKLYDLSNKYKEFKIEDVKIKDPNNPAKLRGAKLMMFKRDI